MYNIAPFGATKLLTKTFWNSGSMLFDYHFDSRPWISLCSMQMVVVTGMCEK